MRFSVWLIFAMVGSIAVAADSGEPQFDRDIAPLLKRHCVKCHGPTKHEAKLSVATAGGIIRGGKTGAALVPHAVEASLLWQRIASDEMPPETPLTADEKELVRRWIAAGAIGLRRDGDPDDADHWAFRRLAKTVTAPIRLPHSSLADLPRSPIDDFVRSDLQRDGLQQNGEASRAALIRRLSFDLTGLPPDPDLIAEFQADSSPDAYERVADRYLASAHFGERLGKVWLDAAGYADSNGYFSADTDRPLAFRYRDYVIRAINSDRQFDQFVREQIAGDEIAALPARNGEIADLNSASPEEAARLIELLEATHYLRCGQDGSGESDGNPDEVRVDRYTVLETAMQNVSTGLMGLTIQCAKCHDHKFEPLTQRDYYSLQAVLIPAFPPDQWIKPNDRFVYASLPGEFEKWQASVALSEQDVSRLSDAVAAWVREHRPRGTTVFSDSFGDDSASLVDRWSNVAPGDDAPGGTVPVNVDSREAPGAIIVKQQLQLIEGGSGGDKWLSTRDPWDWTPDLVGGAIQVTFDLVDNRIGEAAPAERIGYFIALNDFNDNGPTSGGNILIDGHPSASTAVFVDYPGTDSRQVGAIGNAGYSAGHNYGVRITNKGEGKYLLQHLVDWQVEEKSITLAEADLPDGGFGFEFCCNRSFIVDNVVIEAFAPTDKGDPLVQFLEELKIQRASLDAAQKRKASLSVSRPGKIAWTTDVASPAPQVHVLLRGNYHSPGEVVEPAGFACLSSTNDNPQAAASSPRSSGRRLKFAEWLTTPDSPRSALLARVQVNRLWQHHFGTGIVASADNFGISGTAPSHPELLEWLANRFVQSRWSTRQVVREIIQSSTYRQSSQADELRLKADADGRRLSRFPVRRLDAEAIRDSLLTAAGDLDDRMFGPYVPTTRVGTGETIVQEHSSGARRRSIYLQQKRTQVHSLLQVFDAPSIVFNSIRRPRSTMPLQSLSLLNSDFTVARSRSLGERVINGFASDSERIRWLWARTTGQEPSEEDIVASVRFLQDQIAEYPGQPDSSRNAWADLSQVLLIGNAALYLD